MKKLREAKLEKIHDKICSRSYNFKGIFNFCSSVPDVCWGYNGGAALYNNQIFAINLIGKNCTGQPPLYISLKRTKFWITQTIKANKSMAL